MQTENSREEGFNQALAELARLRQFSGTPAEFWPAFLRCGAAVAGASQAVLALRRAQAPDAWQKLSQWSPGGPVDQDAAVFARQLRDIADQCAKQGPCLTASPGGSFDIEGIRFGGSIAASKNGRCLRCRFFCAKRVTIAGGGTIGEAADDRRRAAFLHGQPGSAAEQSGSRQVRRHVGFNDDSQRRKAVYCSGIGFLQWNRHTAPLRSSQLGMEGKGICPPPSHKSYGKVRSQYGGG